MTVSNCANPECDAAFLYLHEGELFVIELPDKSVACYWLCPSCAKYLRVVFDPEEGAKVIAKLDSRDGTPLTDEGAA